MPSKYARRVHMPEVAKEALIKLAARLGFIIPQGQSTGEGSATDMLISLTAAYRECPEAVEQALRGLGVEKKGGEE